MTKEIIEDYLWAYDFFNGEFEVEQTDGDTFIISVFDGEVKIKCHFFGDRIDDCRIEGSMSLDDLDYISQFVHYMAGKKCRIL